MKMVSWQPSRFQHNTYYTNKNVCRRAHMRCRRCLLSAFIFRDNVDDDDDDSVWQQSFYGHDQFSHWIFRAVSQLVNIVMFISLITFISLSWFLYPRMTWNAGERATWHLRMEWKHEFHQGARREWRSKWTRVLAYKMDFPMERDLISNFVAKQKSSHFLWIVYSLCLRCFVIKLSTFCIEIKLYCLRFLTLKFSDFAQQKRKKPFRICEHTVNLYTM